MHDLDDAVEMAIKRRSSQGLTPRELRKHLPSPQALEESIDRLVKQSKIYNRLARKRDNEPVYVADYRMKQADRLVALDTETHLIKPGCAAPKLVCVSADAGNGPSLFDAADGIALFEECLRDPHTHITGHHFFFDLAVFAMEKPDLLGLIFDAVDQGRVHCTRIREMILANAAGELKFVENELGELKAAKFGLADILYRRFKISLDKSSDTWRMRYHLLDGKPLDEWPSEARDYALKDAEYAYMLFMAQEGDSLPEGVLGEHSQTQAAWALYLMGAWGIRTDPEAVSRFRENVSREYAEQEDICRQQGFVRDNGTMNTKAVKQAIKAWFIQEGLNVPTTDAGNIKTNRDTLAQVGISLRAVSERSRLRKLKTTYLPILEDGVKYPINPNYNPIIETFRTSCRTPNCQNPPRKGGFRGCFVPRPGWLYVFCDYSTLEMRTLAQICLDLFGFSYMADALRQGKDLHLMVAAQILDISYNEALKRQLQGDDEVKAARAAAKPANFGFPGGMGPRSFVEFAWNSYGVRVDYKHAQTLKATFLQMWPEMDKYFQYCSGQMDITKKEATVVFARSGLMRGKVRYTAVCNGYFQHLAAMGAKEALYHVSRECYLNETEDLAGCRPVFFIHDEIGLEVPYAHDYAKATRAARRLSYLMESTMRKWVPDIETPAEPALMRRWYKGAEPVERDGMLVPCRPVKQGGKTLWVED